MASEKRQPADDDNGNVDFPSKKKRQYIRKAKLQDLPNEILDLIIKFAGQFDYHTYRLLRCVPYLKKAIDNQYLVLTNLYREPRLFKVPNDLKRSSTYKFDSFTQFLTLIDAFCNKRCRFSDLKLFCEFDKHGHCLKIINYLNLKRINHTLFPIGNLNELDFPSRRQTTKNTIILENPSKQLWSSQYLASSPIKFYSNRDLRKIEINNRNFHLCKHYLDPSSYYWKHEIEYLEELKLFVGKRKSLSSIRSFIFQNLRFLELKEGGFSSKKLLNFKNFTFLHLKELTLALTKVSGFSKNNFPSLESLKIISCVDESKVDETSLTMVSNQLPRLKVLWICVDFVLQLHSNTFGNDLEAVRIDTSLQKIVGSLGDFPELLSKPQKLTLSVREDPTMVQNLFRSLHLMEKLIKLTIIDPSSEDLSVLEKIHFPKLLELNLYKLSDMISEFPNNFQMHQLQRLQLIDTSIEKVKIRNLPNLRCIVFNQRQPPQPREILRTNNFRELFTLAGRQDNISRVYYFGRCRDPNVTFEFNFFHDEEPDVLISYRQDFFVTDRCYITVDSDDVDTKVINLRYHTRDTPTSHH